MLGRFLEHSRIFSFHHAGDQQTYIGSSDMMHRNLDRRIEVLIRLTETEHLDRLEKLFDLHMSEKSAGWVLQSDGNWKRREGDDLQNIHEILINEYAARDSKGKAK